jgi:hypothetical protein
MKRTIGCIVLAALGVSVTLPASAGDLVLSGRVVRIANTGNNQDVFSIEVAGGTQNLCSGVWINFPVGAAANPDTHKRAYATALTALTAGLLVRVYNYQGNSCDQASYIELSAG